MYNYELDSFQLKDGIITDMNKNDFEEEMNIENIDV